MTPQEILLKCQKNFPEDPDRIHAIREEKKQADNQFRAMLIKKNHNDKRNLDVLEKARAARAATRQVKPKTTDGTK